MRVYYDSCVFGNALNAEQDCHERCKAATSASKISWLVTLSTQVSVGEMPSIKPAIDAFFIECALAGVTIDDVSLASAKVAAKPYIAQKKALSQMAFQGNDWNHLMCAVASDSVEVWTVDDDFFDPRNKSVKGSAKKSVAVASYIRKTFGIQVKHPP